MRADLVGHRPHPAHVVRVQAHRAAHDHQPRLQGVGDLAQSGHVDVHPGGVVGQVVDLEAGQARGPGGVVRRVAGGGIGERQDAVAGAGRGEVDVEVRDRSRGDPQLGVAAGEQAADRLLGEQLELLGGDHSAVVLGARVAEVRAAPDRRAGQFGEPRVRGVRAGVQHEAVAVGVQGLLVDQPVQLGVELVRAQRSEPWRVVLTERAGSAPSHGRSVNSRRTYRSR